MGIERGKSGIVRRERVGGEKRGIGGERVEGRVRWERVGGRVRRERVGE